MEGLLRERGFAEQVVLGVVEGLASDGALDDAHFAERYAADKREISGWGPERIRSALLRRGLERSLVEEAVAADGYEEQVERGLNWLAARDPDLESEAARSRALAALARQGYESEPAYEVVRRLERDERDAEGNG